MNANKKELVRPNYEALKADMNRYGINGKQLSERIGKNKNYIATTFALDRASREVIGEVEKAMFREAGAYCIEIEEESKPEPKPVMTEGMGILLKQIGGKLDLLLEKLTLIFEDQMAERKDRTKDVEALVKAIRETQAENKLVMDQILDKEIQCHTMLCRMKNLWEGEKK